MIIGFARQPALILALISSVTSRLGGAEGFFEQLSKCHCFIAPPRPEVTEETRAKMSASALARPKMTEETRAKKSELWTGEKNPMYGKKHSTETRAKMSKAKSNMSFEKKKKMSAYHQARPKVTCPNCGKEGKKGGAMTRYHFDNCKKRVVIN